MTWSATINRFWRVKRPIRSAKPDTGNLLVSQAACQPDMRGSGFVFTRNSVYSQDRFSRNLRPRVWRYQYGR
jgi:hypothetical protein